MSTPDQTITEFRRQIDALDDEIIALLLRRIELVKNVGAAKREAFPGACPIRAGREAEMLRRIVKKFEGTPVSPSAMAAVWRILIGSSTCLESPLSLSVFAPEKDETFFRLAREYFGPTLPITRQMQIHRVVGDVMDGKVSVGIVPNLSVDDVTHWWGNLMSDAPGTPKIFAHVPFVYDSTMTRNAPSALAIGRVAPEDTGNDLSFVALDADHHVSQHRLQGALTDAGLSARWITITFPDTSTRRHLLEISGFVMPGHAGMTKFESALGSALRRVSYLGAYAVPIDLRSSQLQAPYPHAYSS